VVSQGKGKSEMPGFFPFALLRVRMTNHLIVTNPMVDFVEHGAPGF